MSYSDGAGNTTTTTYDALDRPVTVTDSAPSTTTYAYDTTTDRAACRPPSPTRSPGRSQPPTDPTGN
nr:hypothetical protein [Actinacidiphila paucisporea]